MSGIMNIFCREKATESKKRTDMKEKTTIGNNINNDKSAEREKSRNEDEE